MEPRMKEALALIGIVALAATLWLLKANGDAATAASQDVTISTLQDAVRSQKEMIAKDDALIDAGNVSIKSLQDTIKSKDEMIMKDDALVVSKDDVVKSLQGDLQSKDDVIRSLQNDLQSKDTIIEKDNALISSYEEQLATRSNQPENEPPTEEDNHDICPEDNGFDAQDLGSGFMAYQVFGPLLNPTGVTQPARIPNHTPWKFGPGNSGITANGSAFFMSGATNGDSDGATSTNGQAAFLEFDGSSFSQFVNLHAGTYAVVFDYRGAPELCRQQNICVSRRNESLRRNPDGYQQLRQGGHAIRHSSQIRQI